MVNELTQNKERTLMRRLSGFGRHAGGLMFVVAAAALAGCSEDPRFTSDAAAGNGGGGTGGGSGSGGTAPGGSGGATGGNGGGTGGGGTGGGIAGGGGSIGGGGGGGAGGTGTGGGAGVGGGVAGGGGSAGGPAGSGGTGGGAGGAAGTGGSAGATGVAGAGGSGGAAGSGGGAGGTAGAGATAGTGGGAGTLAAPAISGAAVLNSDFSSTSVSLLNTQGGLTRADCVHSMTTGTGSKTISGDVVLPSQPQRGGQVVLVDRGNTALTFVNPGTCTVDRQLSVMGGFNIANPHDVVIVGDSKAYVTRYKKNSAPANPMAAGDDILIIDPRDGAIAGRIDLSAFATTAYPASPDRAVIAAGKVVVTLNRWNSTTFAYDAGSVVIIDPASNQVVQHLALGGLKNCEGMDYLAATRTVLVACGGSFASPEQALESGIAVIDMSGANATLARIISGVAFATRPVNFLWVIALPSATNATRAFAATMGSFNPSVQDKLYQFDFVTGATTPFGMATPYDLGRPVGGGGRLLMPDANAAMPRIHVYDVSGAGAPTETAAFVPDTVNGLPPREVAWY
jgi:hypothetical protein